MKITLRSQLLRYNVRAMGSWNETCMVTQLPITPGDLVKLVFIRWSPLKNRPFNGGVYHTDTWTVLMIG